MFRDFTSVKKYTIPGAKRIMNHQMCQVNYQQIDQIVTRHAGAEPKKIDQKLLP